MHASPDTGYKRAAMEWTTLYTRRWLPDGTPASTYDLRIRHVTIVVSAGPPAEFRIHAMHEFQAYAQTFGPFDSEEAAQAKAADLESQLGRPLHPDVVLR